MLPPLVHRLHREMADPLELCARTRHHVLLIVVPDVPTAVWLDRFRARSAMSAIWRSDTTARAAAAVLVALLRAVLELAARR